VTDEQEAKLIMQALAGDVFTVTVANVSIEYVEVTISKSCPKCGVRFDDQARPALVWDVYTQEADTVVLRDDDYVEAIDSADTYGDTVSLGYRCGDCSTVIAEGTRTEKGPAGR
jgi:uncharacterized protein with PIN domain